MMWLSLSLWHFAECVACSDIQGPTVFLSICMCGDHRKTWCNKCSILRDENSSLPLCPILFPSGLCLQSKPKSSTFVYCIWQKTPFYFCRAEHHIRVWRRRTKKSKRSIFLQAFHNFGFSVGLLIHRWWYYVGSAELLKKSCESIYF